MTLQIEHQVSLQAHNSMGVPATASHLVRVQTIAELKQAIRFSQQHKLEPLVLGEGSNTIFENDFNGLIILNRLLGIEVLEESDTQVIVRVAAGQNWHEWVSYCLAHAWHGLENLALIPGLVGAAPIQNIGAYGVELQSRVISVDIIELDGAKQRRLSNEQCAFAYRDSVFKHALAGKAFVTGVTFNLSKSFAAQLSYSALLSHFETPSPSAQEVFAAVCEIRSSKLPLPAQIPNTGSFFKNPVVDAQRHQLLRQNFPDIVAFQHGDDFKLAAAWMIEHAGWKKKQIDGVHVHPQQALVIVNPEHKSGALVLAFAAEIQASIKQIFSVELEIEPRVY